MTAPHLASSKREMRRHLLAGSQDGSAQFSSCLRDGRDLAEQPMLFVVDAGGEIERGCRPGAAPIAEAKSPEPINGYRLVAGIEQKAVEVSGLQIEDGNLAAAELADQHLVADAERTARPADGGAAAETR